jgi:gliding motility-associated-like protein
VLKARLILFVFGLFGTSVMAQAQTFVKVIGQPGRNEAGFVAHQAPTGELYIGGNVNDSALVQRIDADGNVLWSRTFKPPGQFRKNVVHITSTSDGGIIGCGTGYVPTGDPVEGFHFRMDAGGNVLWVRTWDDPRIYERRMVEVGPAEFLMFGGVFEPSVANFSDVLTARIDASTGDLLWLSDLLDQYAPVPYIGDMASVARIGDSFYASCSLFTNGSPLSTRRVGLSKFNIMGQHVETRFFLYSNSADRRLVTSDIIASDDSLTLTYFGDINGSSTNFTQGLIRMDTLGNIAWARDFNVGGSAMEQNTKVVAAPFGYVIAGRTMSTTPVRLFLMAVSVSGDLLWTKTYGSVGQAQTLESLYASNLVALSDGFLLTGTVDQGGGERDLLLIRTDINGDVECSDVTPRNALTTLLPEFTFPSPTQQVPFTAALGMAPTVVEDGQISDACVIDFTLGNDTTSCATITLDPGAIPGATYEWQDGTTGQTLDATASGTYWVRVSVDCCVASDTVEVEIGALTALDLGNDTLVCGADGLLLEAPVGSADLLWSDGSTDPELLVVETGTYWLTVTSGSCSVSDTIAVEVAPLPTVVIEGELVSCDGSALELEAVMTGEEDFVWDDGSTELLRTVNVSAEVWVQVTNQCGSVADTVQVTVVEGVSIDLGNDTLLCAGQTLLLQAEAPGWEFLWSDGSVGNSLNIVEEGIYWLEASNSGCAVRDSITVAIQAPPTAALGADTTVCGGATLLLQPTLTNADEVSWSTGSTADEITITTSGLYTVTVTNACGSASDGIDVLMVPALEVGVGPDTLLCTGDTLLLDITGTGFDVLWMDTFTGTSFTITEAGTYWVEGTSNGCLERDTIAVDYTRLALLDLGPDTVVCDAPFLELDAGEEGLDALWQNGTRDRYHTVLRTGSYMASITNYCGTITDSIRVSFGIAPVPLDTVDLCPGRTVELDPGGEMLLTVWSTGDTVRSILVGEGEYRYEALDVYGCPHADSTVVRITAERDGVVYVPNSFTPNTDGYNDVWGVVGAEEREFALALYDRWGQEIYRSNDPLEGWDGTYGGAPVPPGAYVFTVTYRDRCDSSETEVTKLGHVIVVR